MVESCRKPSPPTSSSGHEAAGRPIPHGPAPKRDGRVNSATSTPTAKKFSRTRSTLASFRRSGTGSYYDFDIVPRRQPPQDRIILAAQCDSAQRFWRELIKNEIAAKKDLTQKIAPQPTGLSFDHDYVAVIERDPSWLDSVDTTKNVPMPMRLEAENNNPIDPPRAVMRGLPANPVLRE
jgi:hypothetical protein